VQTCSSACLSMLCTYTTFTMLQTPATLLQVSYPALPVRCLYTCPLHPRRPPHTVEAECY
jgi:hypothetical protein